MFSASASPSLSSHPQWQFRDLKDQGDATPKFQMGESLLRGTLLHSAVLNVGNNLESDAQILIPNASIVLMVQEISQATT